MNQVVVTGMYAISPAGVGLEPLWNAVRDGNPCGGPITQFDCSKNAAWIAAQVNDFDVSRWGIEPDEAAGMDRATQFAVAAASSARQNAGLDPLKINPYRSGVCIGTAIGGVDSMERAFQYLCCREKKERTKPKKVDMKPDKADPRLWESYCAHSVSHEVARRNGFYGFCTTMSTGCTAGIDAIGLSSELIADGVADVMVTGGTDAPITPIVLSSFDNIRCLTRRNNEPTRASRPFDRNRDGFLLAEGCAILVLESAEHARKRGAEIIGYVLGYASLSNAYHMTGLPADGIALGHTLQQALNASRINPEEVDYINAHGSSTPQNDRNETAALKLAFLDHARKVPISSTKSVLGHPLGAASALESVVSLLAIQEGVAPPTANYETPDPDCDLDYVPNQPRETKISVVECNASGFSGIHSSILFGNIETGRKVLSRGGSYQ
jgi:3-oxoacyl-(acyl-carrier-protein) synthase